MPIQFQLQPNQIADLRAIRDIDPNSLTAVVSALQQPLPKTLEPSELKRVISSHLPNEAAAEALLRQSLAFSGLMRQRKLETDAILEALRAAIQARRDRWTEQELAAWSKVEPCFKAIIGLPIIYRVSKVLDLSYDYANLWQSARILTDVRPVFSRDADQIDGAVISFTMRLRYDSLDGDHSLSLAMNESDVQALRDKCDRALMKARTAKAFMSEKSEGVPTIISGESDNAKT
jgi:hypothetical protein